MSLLAYLRLADYTVLHDDSCKNSMDVRIVPCMVYRLAQNSYDCSPTAAHLERNVIHG